MKLKAASIGCGYRGTKLKHNFINSSKCQINFVAEDKPSNLIEAKNEILLAIKLSDFKKIREQIPNLIFFNINK